MVLVMVSDFPHCPPHPWLVGELVPVRRHRLLHHHRGILGQSATQGVWAVAVDDLTPATGLVLISMILHHARAQQPGVDAKRCFA